MSAGVPLYQDVVPQLQSSAQQAGVRSTSVRRLALFVTGVLAAQSCVLAQIAAELCALGLTTAARPEHGARRRRRALADPRLVAATGDEPLVRVVLQAALVGQPRVLLARDDSSQDDRVHLLRLSLLYSTRTPAWSPWAAGPSAAGCTAPPRPRCPGPCRPPMLPAATPSGSPIRPTTSSSANLSPMNSQRERVGVRVHAVCSLLLGSNAARTDAGHIRSQSVDTLGHHWYIGCRTGVL